MKKFLRYTFLYTASLFLALSFFNTDRTFEEVADQALEGQILPDYVQIYGPFGFYMNVDSINYLMHQEIQQTFLQRILPDSKDLF